tara:strand:+ start:1648 stop:2697 length:1050 start_codon:yes stop_codon:yes gene_type:complete
MKLLVTGGAGFIGTHTSLLLLEQGYDLVIYDSFYNSTDKVFKRFEKILKFDETFLSKRIKVIKGDIRDKNLLEEVFNYYSSSGNSFSAVLHFAGLKSVSESVIKPNEYWDVNLLGTKNLVEVMAKYYCYKLVFSSSATIYGSTSYSKINEDHNINPHNPYGHTKAAAEYFLTDLYHSNDKWSLAILRYFNPVGAHSSGQIGEDPFGVPNNLFPYISQVAIGRLEKLLVFGNDWPTTDGTGIRDYIHVIDLAEGHISALEKLLDNDKQILKLNLGSGKGHSVLDVIKTFSKVTGVDIPYEITNRRSGDTAKNVADPSLSKKTLGWETKKTLFEMCKDSWNWQTKNPNGYY